MQESVQERVLSPFLTGLDRLVGERLPEKVQDRAASLWLFSGVFWMLIGMSLGMIEAIKMIYPNFLGGVYELSFGRLRPAHVNTVLFGWMTMASVGASLAIIPRLTKRHLYWGELAVVAGWGYNLITALGIVTLALGLTKGKEYQEWILPLNTGVLICINLVAACLFITLIERKYEKLYVSVWYFLMAYLALDLVYFMGNLPIYAGAQDAAINWFYGHNVIGMWLSACSIGTLYYVVPKTLQKKLFSHALSLWSFWLFAAFYVWNGGHHLVYGPVPMVIPMLGIIFALGMTLPVGGTFINMIGTIWGRFQDVRSNLTLRFAVLALACYFLASYEGSMEAVEAVNVNSHFTDFSIAHAHIGFLGFTSSALMAFTYHFVEQMLKRKPLPVLTSLHFWLFLIGFGLYIVPIQMAGIVEAIRWSTLDSNHIGDLVGALVDRYPYYWLRVCSGVFLISGQLIFAWNMIWAFQAPATGQLTPSEAEPLPVD
ncbi:MAG: cbb3-type cytochrome c oxidase subunit I [Leptolyngbya sp. BL-A-14]